MIHQPTRRHDIIISTLAVLFLYNSAFCASHLTVQAASGSDQAAAASIQQQITSQGFSPVFIEANSSGASTLCVGIPM